MALLQLPWEKAVGAGEVPCEGEVEHEGDGRRRAFAAAGRRRDVAGPLSECCGPIPGQRRPEPEMWLVRRGMAACRAHHRSRLRTCRADVTSGRTRAATWAAADVPGGRVDSSAATRHRSEWSRRLPW